jgi:hypothetical protein
MNIPGSFVLPWHPLADGGIAKLFRTYLPTADRIRRLRGNGCPPVLFPVEGD